MKRLRRVLARATEVAAQVSVSKIIDVYYDEFATELSGRYWWWCQLVLLDPNELIVNDGEDNLYRVPFTISGEDVTFGEPVAIKVEYIDLAARGEQVAAACAGIATVRGDKVAARYDSRADSCPDRKEGGTNMKELMQKLRAKFDLPADTPDEEVLRVAAEAGPGESEEPPVPQPAEQPGTGGAEPPEPGTVETETEETQGGGTEARAGTVVVDAAALAQLQADAKAGREARDIQIASTDGAVLAEAVKVGKFPPARKEHFATLLKADREGTIALIESLEENVVPVKLRGETPQQEANAAQGYPVTWLPEVAARKAAQEAASASRVTMAEGGS